MGRVSRAVGGFGSALNLYLHFHALLLDGVVTCESPFTRAVFHPAADLEDQDADAAVGQMLQNHGTLHQLAQQLSGEPQTELTQAARVLVGLDLQVALMLTGL